MSGGVGGLDLVDEGGDGVDSVVVGARPKLCHWEKGVSGYIDVYSFGNDLFHQLASTLQQADGPVGFRQAVVGAVRFVEDYHHGVTPQVCPQV